MPRRRPTELAGGGRDDRLRPNKRDGKALGAVSRREARSLGSVHCTSAGESGGAGSGCMCLGRVVCACFVLCEHMAS